MFMEAMLGISNIAILISTSKNVFSFLLLLMSSLQQNLRKGQNRFCLEARVVVGRGKGWRAGEKMTKTMYAHMSIRINREK
jgi:hypothetical protein